MHWIVRGGVILPRRHLCSAIEDEPLPPHSRGVLHAMAVRLAQIGACPSYAPPPPDAYRAKDITDEGEPNHETPRRP
jgi:hypothetical protein